MCFAKPTYQEISLPFRLIENPADFSAGMISIEAYGNVFGAEKYCYACYELKNSEMYENGAFDEMLKLLRNSTDKTLKVMIKLKKGMPKDFKIDVASLAEAYGDERFNTLALLGRGFHDKSQAN